MDAAGIFLILLVLFCVLQGVLIARVRGLSSEISILKSALPGNASPKSAVPASLPPEAVAALASVMAGGKDE